MTSTAPDHAVNPEHFRVGPSNSGGSHDVELVDLPPELMRALKISPLSRLQRTIITQVVNRVSCTVTGGPRTGRTTAALLTVVFARLNKITIFVTPTKEAAVQAAGVGNIIALGHGTLTVSCLVGKGGPASPLSSTGEAQRLIVTTPGKLIKALRNCEIVPEDVGTVVLDGGDTLLDTETGCGHHCSLVLQSLSAASPTLLVISNTAMPIPAAMQEYQSPLVTIEVPGLWEKRGDINYLLSPKSTRFEEIRKLLSEAGSKKPATTLLVAETIAQAESLQKFLGNGFTLVHSGLPDDVRFERVTQFNKGQISLIGCRVPSSGPDLALAQLVVFFEPPARWGDLADLLEKLNDHGNLYICYDPENSEESNRILAVQANFESAKKGQMITNQSGGRRLDPTRRLQVTGIPAASKEEVAQWFPVQDRTFEDSGGGATGRWRYFDFESAALAEQFKNRYQHFQPPGQGMWSLELEYVTPPNPGLDPRSKTATSRVEKQKQKRPTRKQRQERAAALSRAASSQTR